MKTYGRALLMLMLCTVAYVADGETVDSFLLDPRRAISDPFIGTDGEVWIADHEGMLRVGEGGFETVCELPVEIKSVPQVTVSPSGTIYLNNFQWEYRPETGVTPTDIEEPSIPEGHERSYGLIRGIIDAEERMFSIKYYYDYMQGYSSDYRVYELFHGHAPEYRLECRHVQNFLAVSASEFWIVDEYHRPHYHPLPTLWVLDLDQSLIAGGYEVSGEHTYVVESKDSLGRLWLSDGCLVTLQDGVFTRFAGDDWVLSLIHI